MYKKETSPKFLVALGIICATFAVVCCTIAYVRLFRASRQYKNSQETLAAQTEELEDIKKELEKASRQEKNQTRRKRRKTATETPEPTMTPAISENAVVSKNENKPTPKPTVPSQPTPDILSANEGEGENGQLPQIVATGGHTIAIDPGHQGPHVDMSATEPNGPNSSEMKTKATTGTSGVYSGLGEYQLNLDVSLKLKQILEDRGYQVVMCRTDNDTAISNAERALLAAESGAEIYVRIHANGSDDHGVQGALSMSPSPDNPYIPQLYADSQRLSQILLDSYCAATGFENRGVQYTDTMTGINWSQVPVTILEMGFMSNEHDDLAMADSNFQQTMAEGIANGIDTYFSQN